MQRRFNLLAFPANMTDATSFYRAIGPLGQLRRSEPWLNIQIIGEINWTHLEMTDGLFLQRPFRPQFATLCEKARAQGKPIWVDHDDNVVDVPTDNPCHQIYMDPGIQKSVARILAMADHVTVSTPALKRLYGGLNENIRVVPNALMNTIIGEPMETASTNPVVMWRGSDTHTRDLMTHTDGIVEAARANPEWRWNFAGYNPYFLTERLPSDRVSVIPPLDLIEYFAMLRAIRPSVVVVPLADNPFNHAKSNIAWIEAIYAGAIVVAPSFDEWKRPGVVNYSEPGDITRALSEAMQMSAERRATMRAEGLAFIDTTLRIERVNGTRRDILRDMAAWNASPSHVTSRLRNPMVSVTK